jgi:hypothetical protein
MIHDGPLQYPRIALMKSAMPWRFEGLRHEYAVCEGVGVPALLEGIVYRRIGGGARDADPRKFLADAETFEEALRRDPTNARNVFYLARSYEDAGELPRALAQYDRRALMGGWDEELFYAAYCAARVREKLGFPREAVARGYMEAWHLRPTRAEPLYDLARLARLAGEWPRARAYAAAATAIPRPRAEVLFVHWEIYAWRALDEYAAACAHIGDVRAAIDASHLLLRGGRLPPDEVARVEANLASLEGRMIRR